jgi:hypothetical protein
MFVVRSGLPRRSGDLIADSHFEGRMPLVQIGASEGLAGTIEDFVAQKKGGTKCVLEVSVGACLKRVRLTMNIFFRRPIIAVPFPSSGGE